MAIFKFLFVVLCASMGNAHTWTNQEDYEDFLMMINHQNAQLQKQRDTEFFYKPEPGLFDVVNRYSEDRHGGVFVKCREFNNTSGQESNIRCPIRSAAFHAVCQTIYDYSRREIIQGCMDLPYFDNGTCGKDCYMQFKMRPPMGSLPGASKKSIGWCCCTGDLCNADYKKIITEGIYNNKVRLGMISTTEAPHHHHHKRALRPEIETEKEPSTFWDRLF